MEEELDLITLEDEDGNEITAEVMDYFYYNGKQYALLAPYKEANENCENCEQESCEGCEDAADDAFIMEIRPVGEDEEEFVTVDDEALYDQLIDFVNNDMYVDAEDDDEE